MAEGAAPNSKADFRTYREQRAVTACMQRKYPGRQMDRGAEGRIDAIGHTKGTNQDSRDRRAGSQWPSEGTQWR